MTQPDPFRYFRLEAREIVVDLGKGILELERGDEDPAKIAARLLRGAHTLKGAARVVRHTMIAEQAHALETVLAPLRSGGGTLSPAAAEEALGIVDAIRAAVDALDAAPRGGADSPPSPRAAAAAVAVSPVAAPVPAEEPVRAVRADLIEMDALAEGLAEVMVQLAAVRATTDRLERARLLAQRVADQIERSYGAKASTRLRGDAGDLVDALTGAGDALADQIDAVGRELEQVRDAAERLRLVPVASVFPFLERAARDAAREVGLRVAFHGSGGDVRLDADVVATLQGALVQAVRNTVAHGIEPDAERLAAGKSVPARIELVLSRRAGRAILECRDDGRGIDLPAVRRAAAAAGTPGAADASEAELLELLLRGGVSTSRAVSAVAGRGVGLDVIRESVRRLGGTIELETRAGRGLTVRLAVPLTLSAFDALVVETEGGSVAAIPLVSVRRTLRVAATDVSRTPQGDTILDEGEVIPLVPLARLLRTGASSTARVVGPAVVVAGRGLARAAVAVDRLVGRAAVVVRRLPDTAPALALVAGAAIDADGNPRIVLDPDVLVANARASSSEAALPKPAGRPPVLVVDDSLTTRMLEQSILEAAGYEVDVATSAEEGLEKARKKRYGACLVDVEMPGMDGFSFVETTRREPDLMALPCILVTSRDAPEDRRRGHDAGARGYVVKGEFDQKALLDALGRLVEEGRR